MALNGRQTTPARWRARCWLSLLSPPWHPVGDHFVGHPGLLGTAAIVYAIRTAPRLTERPRRPLRVQVRPVLRGRLGRLRAGITLFEVGNVAATRFILRAIDQLRPDLGTDDATRVALPLYTGYNLVATLMSVSAGRLSDRLGRDGRRRVLPGGLLRSVSRMPHWPST